MPLIGLQNSALPRPAATPVQNVAPSTLALSVLIPYIGFGEKRDRERELVMTLKGTKKAVAKTFTYRFMNGFYGFGVAMFVTGNWKVAAGVVGAEAAYKMFAYFAHEKVWDWFAG